MVVLFSNNHFYRLLIRWGPGGDADLKRIHWLLSKGIAALFYQMSLFHHREMSVARDREDNVSELDLDKYRGNIDNNASINQC